MKRIGFERDGGHADYVAVPAANLVALPAEISYEAAAILPDAVACMYHSLIHQGGVGIGQRVLILGRRRPRHPRRADRAGARVPRSSRPAASRSGSRWPNGTAPSASTRPGSPSRRRWPRSPTARASTWSSTTSATARASARALPLLRPGGKFLVVAYLDETFEIPSMPLFKTELQIIGCRGSTKQDLIDVVRLVQARTGDARARCILRARSRSRRPRPASNRAISWGASGSRRD